jgi:ankyrin repeat protein
VIPTDAARPIEPQAERLLEAIRADKTAVARRLLGAHPSLDRFSIHTAAAIGNTEAVAEFLRRDPALAHATHSPEEWPPLAYACRSGFHRVSERHASGLRRIATMLMDAGASANSFSVFFESDHKKAPISVLYHACMSDHVALVNLLLERGANPMDGESIYHAAQHNRQACLELMLGHGADLSSRQQPYGNTPLYFLVGHHDDQDGDATWFKGFTWLLDHGADPNVTSDGSGEAPLHGVAASAPKLATVRQLLAHGADVNLPRADGRTPFHIAVRHGNVAVAAVLREHGARADMLQPMDEFLGACLAADDDRARSLLAAHPDLFPSMTDDDKAAMADAVRQNNGDALRLMVDLGFQLTWQEGEGGTPLHNAAWLGRVDLVKLLIALGAPINLRDGHYGSSPLGWAAHGSGCHSGHDDAYCAIVDLLLDAGADRETSINKWGEPPENMASARVAKRLKERAAS